VSLHITREEEAKIGIDPEDTDYYRDAEGVPSSDDIQAMAEDEREGRKRGVFDVSASITYSQSTRGSRLPLKYNVDSKMVSAVHLSKRYLPDIDGPDGDPGCIRGKGGGGSQCFGIFRAQPLGRS